MPYCLSWVIKDSPQEEHRGPILGTVIDYMFIPFEIETVIAKAAMLNRRNSRGRHTPLQVEFTLLEVSMLKRVHRPFFSILKAEELWETLGLNEDDEDLLKLKEAT